MRSFWRRSGRSRRDAPSWTPPWGWSSRGARCGRTPPTQSAGADWRLLTSRELEIMRRVAEGFTNAQIAEELRLGVKSVETYRSRVMDKLGLASRVALVRLALDCGVFGSGATLA